MLSYHAYAEYDTAQESALIGLPRELDSTVIPGEALGCSINVFKRCTIEPGNVVAIVGIGFLGAVLVQLCVKAGAKVIAISRRSFALRKAEKMGADVMLPWDKGAEGLIMESVKEVTGGKGCDRVIEATGVQEALDLATELTMERGKLIIAGYHQDGARQVNMQLWNWRRLDVINAHERDPRVYRNGVQAAVNAVAFGDLDPSPLYTHSFKLNQLGEGLNAMKERQEGFLKGLVII